MRVEKFTGSDIRQAMANVREALGSDAVIISSKRVNDMTEITAAMNYDPKAPESVRMGFIRMRSSRRGSSSISPAATISL